MCSTPCGTPGSWSGKLLSDAGFSVLHFPLASSALCRRRKQVLCNTSWARSPCAVFTALAELGELKRSNKIKKYKLSRQTAETGNLDSSSPGPSRPKDNKPRNNENRRVLVGWIFRLPASLLATFYKTWSYSIYFPTRTHLIFYMEPKRRVLCYTKQESGKMIRNSPLYGCIRRRLPIREISSNVLLIWP